MFAQVKPASSGKQQIQVAQKKNAGGYSHMTGAMGSTWSSEMTSHSKLVINNDPTNMSHLNAENQALISDLYQQIEEIQKIKPIKKVVTGYELFENKSFNAFKLKFSHLSIEEIKSLLKSKWDNDLKVEERDEFESLAKLQQQKLYKDLETNNAKVNELKKQIHDIKFSFHSVNIVAK